MGKFQPPFQGPTIYPTIAIGVVTRIGFLVVEIYVSLDQWDLQQTTNTTTLTYYDVAYTSGFARCSAFIKRAGPTTAPCLFGQL
jgi:hypothetical protein